MTPSLLLGGVPRHCSHAHLARLEPFGTGKFLSMELPKPCRSPNHEGFQTCHWSLLGHDFGDTPHCLSQLGSPAPLQWAQGQPSPLQPSLLFLILSASEGCSWHSDRDTQGQCSDRDTWGQRGDCNIQGRHWPSHVRAGTP